MQVSPARLQAFFCLSFLPVPAEPFGVVAASALVLYRSELTPRGADHEAILRVALESPAAPQ